MNTVAREQTSTSAVPVWLSVRKVSLSLGLSRWKVAQLLEEGRLKAFTIGGKPKVSASELERFMAQEVRPALA